MSYRTHFTIPAETIYLNTAGNGLIPDTIKTWRKERDTVFFEADGNLREQQPAFIQGVKQTIAEVFHCQTNQIFNTANFSVGFNTLLSGLDRNLEFLLLADDYPSLNYPIISRGFKHSFVPLDHQVEQHITQALKERKPDILALSLVQYISGIKIDISFLQEIKAQYPDLYILVDGTQFLGTEPIDFEQSGIDAIGTSGYKWLLSGFGNGFMYISNRLQALLFQDSQNASLAPMWEGREKINIYFEPGHIDTLAQGTMQQSLKFLQEKNLADIQAYLKTISHLAREEFIARNLLSEDIIKRSNQSPIFNLDIDPKHYPYLVAHGVKCFPRGKGIRIAFHLYNTEDDLNSLLKILDHGKI